MKLLYLIDSQHYSYHKDLIGDFESVIPGEILDMSDGTNLGRRYRQISEIAPDIVITFDLAGHVLRTGSDTLSLNNIYARMAHILFHKTEFYGGNLKARQNLSMFTYISKGEDIGSIKDRFPDVPNFTEFVDFSYKPYSEDDHNNNRDNIRSWWEGFKKEIML